MSPLVLKSISRFVLSSPLTRFYSDYGAKGGKKAIVLLAEGTNEIEMAIPICLLRRAGVQTMLTGVPQCQPMATQCKMIVTPDNGICEAVRCGPFDAAVIPGGQEGVKTLACNEVICALLREVEKCDKIIAAIGHGPLVLKAHSIAIGKCLTGNPCLREELCQTYKWSDEKVTRDGALITSQGPGSAFDWALAVIECLVGREQAISLKRELGLC